MSCVVSAPARSRPRIADVLPVLLVVAGGCALRFVHLGTFSLWWDEIVHVWTAQGGTVADVWTHAKQGIPPGTGNAGAVPLDYLLLHLWLRAVPAGAPELLEILVCPKCKGDLEYRPDEQVLVCAACRLAYPVEDDIPIMLIDEARPA